MSKRIKVNIQAEQTVRYAQTVTMTEAQFKAAMAALEENNPRLFANWIDTRDVSDADDISIDYVCEVRP